MNITLPKKTLNNGSYYLHFLLLKPETDLDKAVEMSSVISSAMALVTQYSVPKVEAFNLMGTNSTGQNKSNEAPFTHLHSRVTLSIMSEKVSFDKRSVPGEILPLLRIDQRSRSYLPILLIDRLNFRLKDLVVSRPF